MTMSRKNAHIIKLIALALMTVDHIGFIFENQLPPQLMIMMRMIGRISFPLFAYGISLSAMHTSSKKKYIVRLAVFAVITQPAFMLMSGDLNVIFTFLFSACAIFAYEWGKKKIGYFALIIPVCIGVAAQVLHVDYGIYGVVLVFVFYIFSDSYRKMAVAVFIATIITVCIPMLEIGSIEVISFIALPIIKYFSGTEECMSISVPKYFFYVYYPAHICVLWGIRYILFFMPK